MIRWWSYGRIPMGSSIAKGSVSLMRKDPLHKREANMPKSDVSEREYRIGRTPKKALKSLSHRLVGVGNSTHE
jgi:hypothetical protein